ncbi:MAG TPA: TIGR00730 family Rossman fold protein [Candidatus Udaeobacter sp.]|nr:TIGR00730 family Rossman fold protein [Candidatus Udaeobacter sp.]
MPKNSSLKEDSLSKAEEAENLSTAVTSSAGAVVNYRDSWRIFRIISEFVEGYQFLADLKKEVTILGSARIPRNNKYYKIAEDLGYLLGKNGFTTITGGGPGIMEAANKGAFEGGGPSVGLNIQLPFEQRINPYVNKSIAFYYFFSRKVILTSPANAFVFFPGGFGTLDEFFEVVDNMEIGYMPKVPIILVDSEFWNPIVSFLKAKSSREVHSVSEEEIDRWHIVDTAKEAFEFIKDTPDAPHVCEPGSHSLYCEGGLEWNIFRVMAELVDGFEFLTKTSRGVTVLGTKSLLAGTPYYNAAYETGKILAQNQFATITGGGPGIMEAANKGAFEKGGVSLGINMRVEKGERVNNYITKSIGFFFPFVRKLIITTPSEAFIYFPGGFGTLHQLFEMLTLQETKKIEPITTLLYGKDFWQPLADIIHNLRYKFKTISQIDEDSLKIINDPQEILPYLKK